MKFTIMRSKWLRGEGGGASALLRSRDGKQCCIGQICLQLGLREAEITDRKSLVHLENCGDSDLTQVINAIGSDDGEMVASAYGINDDVDYTEEERKEALATLFAINGHELVFVD